MPIKFNQPGFDFKLQRKTFPAPKLRIITKREVTRQDFVMVKKGMETVFKPGVVFKTMPEKPRQASPLKILASFVTVVLIISLGFQSLNYLASAKKDSGQILGIATSAYGDLGSAANNLESQDFDGASKLFESAQSQLNEASNNLNKYWILTKLVPQANSADHLLAGAGQLAEAGQKLSAAMSLYNNLTVSSKGVETQNFASFMQGSRDTLKDSLDLLESANDHFAHATNLPQEYQPTVVEAQKQILVLTQIMHNLVNLEDLYLAFFGNQDKTYLVVFQNYDELRATGGFIGTYGVLKMSDGSIKELKINSIYDLDGSIYSQIAAPGPFQPDIKKWGTRDANWFADFPTSAQKILQFYEKGKETADGVIALTPRIFSDVLSMTGPIDMPAYGVTLTADNFQEVVQDQTSVEYDKVLNQPKKFLADFAPIMLDHLSQFTKDNWISLLQSMNKSFVSKDMMLFSTDPQTQAKVLEAGFAGQILDAPHDYLYVVNSNHNGTKSDLEMIQGLSVSTELQNDGSLINTVEITRNNTSLETNLDFMRVLVPLGSTLLEASGFDDKAQFSSYAEGQVGDKDLVSWDKVLTEKNHVAQRVESGKTEFSGWVETKSIDVRSVKLVYKLPLNLQFNLLNQTNPYSLLIQKQPGVAQTLISGLWNFAGHKIVWQSPGLSDEDSKVKFAGKGTQDEYWSVLLGR